MNDTAEELEKILIGACNGEDYHDGKIERLIESLRHVPLAMPSPRFGETAAFGIPCGASFHEWPQVLFSQEDGPSEYVGVLLGVHESMSNWVWPLRDMRGELVFRNYGKPVMPWFSLQNNLHRLAGEGRNQLVHVAFSLVQTCLGARDLIAGGRGVYGRNAGNRNAKPWLDLLKGFLLWECDILPSLGLKSWRFRLTTRTQVFFQHEGRDVVIDWEDYEAAEDLKDKILAAKDALDKELPFLS